MPRCEFALGVGKVLLEFVGLAARLFAAGFQRVVTPAQVVAVLAELLEFFLDDAQRALGGGARFFSPAGAFRGGL
jgi:hypothetical protein